MSRVGEIRNGRHYIFGKRIYYEDIVYFKYLFKSNYTSRNVICPDHTLHDNEVDMSYHTFLEVYKDLIIRYLINTENQTLNQAYYQWNAAKIRFSAKVYEIMNYIVEREQPMLLLNRNPTLNYYSMLLLTVRKVKSDFNDYTLSVPLAILPGLNADFDGDFDISA